MKFYSRADWGTWPLIKLGVWISSYSKKSFNSECMRHLLDCIVNRYTMSHYIVIVWSCRDEQGPWVSVCLVQKSFSFRFLLPKNPSKVYVFFAEETWPFGEPTCCCHPGSDHTRECMIQWRKNLLIREAYKSRKPHFGCQKMGWHLNHRTRRSLSQCAPVIDQLYRLRTSAG